jgi:hypothetical protein
MKDKPVFSDETCTELRKDFVAQNTAAVESEDPVQERARLEAIHGKGNVWDTNELTTLFSVKSFLAPFCMVTRKSDGANGAVEFQHYPRFYFNFTAC